MIEIRKGQNPPPPPPTHSADKDREQISPAPQAALSAADHILGNERANLTLLEYGDYECPACIQAAPFVQQLIEDFGPRMNFVFRQFPMFEVHPHAELAAESAEAAAAQGKFWAMHHLLFSNPHHLALQTLVAHAKAIGLDMIRFNAEMADRIYTQRVQEHRRAGEHSGVRATPAFYLNGKLVDVSLGFEKLTQAIHTALHAAAHADTKHR